MIIDIHTHIFPQSIAQKALHSMQQNCHTALFSDGTEHGLIESEKRGKVNLAVVQPVATNPDKVSHLNDSVIAINNDSEKKKMLSFGAMHPAYLYWEQELERIKQAGVVGIKLHPPYEKIDINDPRSLAILRKCRDLNLIVLIHSGKDVGLLGAEQALPEKIRRALDAVGPMKLIAAHMGGWACWDEARTLLSETGIYIDTAFSLGVMTPAADQHEWKKEDLQLLNDVAFCELVHAFGARHVLFGTDSPWAEPEKELSKIRNLQLSKEEIAMILGENAKQLLYEAGAARVLGNLAPVSAVQ